MDSPRGPLAVNLLLSKSVEPSLALITEIKNKVRSAVYQHQGDTLIIDKREDTFRSKYLGQLKKLHFIQVEVEG